LFHLENGKLISRTKYAAYNNGKGVE